MSGHSKWSTIKHQKGTADARRGQLFTKLTREIMMSVREGGSNPEANVKLRLAIQKARDNNMPQENIEKAIKKGSGETEGATLSEMIFEGYGPSGSAILVQALSDNRNRTLQDIRNIFSRHGASLGEAGCVVWLFEPKGLILIETTDLNSEDLVLRAIDSGADDVKVEQDHIEIYTKPEQFEAVRETLKQESIPIASAEITMLPKTTLELEEKPALQTLKILHQLEELDEVQSVSSNVNFPRSVLEKYNKQS